MNQSKSPAGTKHSADVKVGQHQHGTMCKKRLNSKSYQMYDQPNSSSVGVAKTPLTTNTASSNYVISNESYASITQTVDTHNIFQFLHTSVAGSSSNHSSSKIPNLTPDPTPISCSYTNAGADYRISSYNTEVIPQPYQFIDSVYSKKSSDEMNFYNNKFYSPYNELSEDDKESNYYHPPPELSNNMYDAPAYPSDYTSSYYTSEFDTTTAQSDATFTRSAAHSTEENSFNVWSTAISSAKPESLTCVDTSIRQNKQDLELSNCSTTTISSTSYEEELINGSKLSQQYSPNPINPVDVVAIAAAASFLSSSSSKNSTNLNQKTTESSDDSTELLNDYDRDPLMLFPSSETNMENGKLKSSYSCV